MSHQYNEELRAAGGAGRRGRLVSGGSNSCRVIRSRPFGTRRQGLVTVNNVVIDLCVAADLPRVARQVTCVCVASVVLLAVKGRVVSLLQVF